VECQVTSCTKNALGGRYCALHHAKSIEHYDPQWHPLMPKRREVKAVKAIESVKPQPVARETEAKPRCHYLGCERVEFGQQLCRKHFYEIHPEPAKRPRKPREPRQARVCTAEGCDLPHYGLGLCRAHWRKNHQTKRLCQVDTCDMPHSSSGFCQMHYARVRRYGDPEGKAPPRQPTPIDQRPRCSVSDCNRPVSAKGLCNAHYQRQYRQGWEADAAADSTAPRCIEDNCDKPARKLNRCASHYEINRRAQLDADPSTPRCIDCASAATVAGRCRPCYRRNLGR
jgi:hypothetical protein